MGALIKVETIFMINYLLFSHLLIHSVLGRRRGCMEQPSEDIFSAEHYGEVGYPRDVCVDVGRNLIERLHWSKATPFCEKLADIPTSSCYLPTKKLCYKWLRKDTKHANVILEVTNKALDMLEDFNYEIATHNEIADPKDQQFIYDRITIAIQRLKDSQADTQELLRRELEIMKTTFCKKYIQILKNEAQNVDSQTVNQIGETGARNGPGQIQVVKEGQQEEENETRGNGIQRTGSTDWSQQKQQPEARKGNHLVVSKMMQTQEKSETVVMEKRDEATGQIKHCDEYFEAYNDESSNPDDYLEGEETVSAIIQDVEITSTPQQRMIKNGKETDIINKDWIIYRIIANLGFADEQGLSLHQTVFQGSFIIFKSLLDNNYDVKRKDVHGNTPLHLATMLGRTDFIDLLLAHNAPVRSKNKAGWNCIDEAISYGNKDTVTKMLRKFYEQFNKDMVEKRKRLIQKLKNMRDFQMQLRWDFHTWSGGLPADLCRIRKYGSSIRLESHLIDLNTGERKKDKIAMVLDGDTDPSKPSLIFMNLDQKNYIYIQYNAQDVENKLQRKLQEKMWDTIESDTLSREEVTIKEVKDWLKKHKSDKVGRYKAEFYQIDGMALVYRIRSEHIEAWQDEIEKIRAAKENSNPTPKRKKQKKNKTLVRFEDVTLPAPDFPRDVTWEGYLTAEPPGTFPLLGRPRKTNSWDKPIKTILAMAKKKDFDLEVDQFVDILEVLAPFKHVNKLREFLQTHKLPPGFPIRIELPYTKSYLGKISVRFTFKKFEYVDNPPEGPYFVPPKDFVEVAYDNLANKYF